MIAILVTLVIVVLIVCITVYNVMTDTNRLDTQDKRNALDAQVEIEKLKLQRSYVDASEVKS